MESAGAEGVGYLITRNIKDFRAVWSKSFNRQHFWRCLTTPKVKPMLDMLSATVTRCR
jgi:hypothetical protein